MIKTILILNLLEQILKVMLNQTYLKMRFLITMLLCLLVLSYSFPSKSKEIAISIDDAPMGNKLKYSGIERTSIIIDKLRRLNVKVIFFVNSNKNKEEDIDRIKRYSYAGHLIGNHNYYHKSIAELGVNKYKEGIYKADKILKQYPTFVKFYRYPYLNEGDSVYEQESIRSTLNDLDYNNGYVTVDNFDWYMDAIFQKALSEKKIIDYEELRIVYIQIIYDCIKFYDNIALEMLGRSPKHILLLHENDLTAMYIDDLIKHLKNNGWSIINPIEAYNDPLSHIKDNKLFTHQGKIASIGSSRGIDKKKLRHWSENKDNLERYFYQKSVIKGIDANVSIKE